MFSDQLLLQDVLARSDRAMAVVKDLFGDAPRRQTGRLSIIAINTVPIKHVENLFPTHRHKHMQHIFTLLNEIYDFPRGVGGVYSVFVNFRRAPQCDDGTKL